MARFEISLARSCFRVNTCTTCILLVRSFNQPKFCTNASWHPNAITFADSSIVGSTPFAIFVDSNNSVFVARRDNGHILIWRNAAVNPTATILANLSSPYSLFVSGDDEIFVDNGFSNNRVDRWTCNGTRLASPMSTFVQCSGLFVDVNNNLYCSQYSCHQVVRTSLNNTDSTLTIVAGIGCPGSASNMLNSPYGIFVTIDLDLYVADQSNNRIQLFRFGKMNAITVAGNGSNGTITLQQPRGVVLDADGYLFIVDTYHHRIIGSDSGGFRCVAGCSGAIAATPDHLSYPATLSFDTDGNMFVSDSGNGRIQKFLLANNSCGEYKREDVRGEQRANGNFSIISPIVRF